MRENSDNPQIGIQMSLRRNGGALESPSVWRFRLAVLPEWASPTGAITNDNLTLSAGECILSLMGIVCVGQCRMRTNRVMAGGRTLAEMNHGPCLFCEVS